MPIITDLAYDKNGKKRSQTNRALFRRIAYIYEKAERVGSIAVDNQNPKQIYKDFLEVKKEFNSKGINFFHYVLSFDNTDHISAQEVEEIAQEFFEDSKFDGHQVFYGIHNDTDNYHCHFIVNSTNMINGKKFHLNNSERLKWLIKVNKIGLKHNCRVPDKIAKIMGLNQPKKTIVNQDNKKYEYNKRNSWKEKTKNIVEFIIKNVTNENEFKKTLEDVGYELYQNKNGSYIVNISNINRKISFELLGIDYSKSVDRINFNSNQSDTIKENMRLNIENLIKKNKILTEQSDFKKLKDKVREYKYTSREKDTNRLQFYKDLIADINKFVKENNHLTKDYERQLAYILKYNLNRSSNVDEVIEKLQDLGIDAIYRNENQDIIMQIDSLKLSSRYLKIDINDNLKRGISFKYDIYKKVNDVRKIATSKEEFIKILKEQYKIETIWTPEKKYITFIDENGNKKRNSAFYPPERWTKPELEKSFKYNLFRQKKQDNKDFVDRQKFVKSKIYEHLNTCTNYNDFSKKLSADNINFDKTECKFEFQDFKFWKSTYFEIDDEYIQERFNQNKLQNLCAIGSILRGLEQYNSDFKMYSSIKTGTSSMVDIKDMIAERKKGQTINDYAR